MAGPFFCLHVESSKVAEVTPGFEAQPPTLWTGYATLESCRLVGLFLRDGTFQGWPGVRRRLAQKNRPLALVVRGHGALCLQRDFAQQWLAGVPVGEVDVRPLPVRDEAGLVTEDFVLVRPRWCAPLDPAGRGKAPTWAEGHAPPRRLFRLVERDAQVFLDEALARALVAATPGFALEAPAAPKLSGVAAALAAAKASLPGATTRPQGEGLDPGGATAQLEPYWALARGDTDAATRAQALETPFVALAVALGVDGGPRDDTRAAACRAPAVALQYAQRVDGGPHPATEAAVRADADSRFAYATHVLRAIDDDTAQAVLSLPGWTPPDVDRGRREAAAVDAWLKGAPPPPPPAPPPPRAFVTKSLPRYVAAPAGSGFRPIDDPALRSDLDAFLAHGLTSLGLSAAASPDEVVQALAALLKGRREGTSKRPRGKASTKERMALGCAWGEQLHRALDWQWALVGEGQSAVPGLVSPDRRHGHLPFAWLQGHLAAGARSDNALLLFNLLVEGSLPPAQPGAVSLAW